MTSSAGQTRICNLAAVKLGSNEHLSSINDATDLARAFKRVWDEALDQTLVAHPWNPAVRVRSLDRDDDAPVNGNYQYQYRLASLEGSCLRWLPAISPDDDDYFAAEEEDGFLLTNEPGPLNIRFIYRNADLTRWSAPMREVMANRLAFWTSYGRTQLVGVHDRMKVEFEDMLSDAKRLDGLATGNVSRGSVSGRSRWVAARRFGAVAR